MATTRTKRIRAKREEPMPDWAREFLQTRRPPAKDTEEYQQFIGWYFFHDPVPGLKTWRDHPRPIWKEA